MIKLRTLAHGNFENFKNYYQQLYRDQPLPHPVWIPSKTDIEKTNVYQFMKQYGFEDYSDFHKWSVESQDLFIEKFIQKISIQFSAPYSSIKTHKKDSIDVEWFPDGCINIVNSCFQAPKEKTAIIEQTSKGTINSISYGDLELKVNQIANGISKRFQVGTAIAIIMPMTISAIAIYLGIIKAGCIVVSIADSFSSEEILTRLKISNSKAIFTQDYYSRNDKSISIYEKIKNATELSCIVVSTVNKLSLRSQDCLFASFSQQDSKFTAIASDANSTINILFSSGTTGTPKAIPWTHCTPIRCAMDGYFHQDIQSSDRVCWPTNLGWMMGPWLVFASLLNQATLATYIDVPTQSDFGRFVEQQKITILGLVPSIVSPWKTSQCMEKFNWQHIKCFSSSGECSSPEDYLYLMWLGNCKPIIEYCGGTEIGGGYISSTLIHANSPSCFTTPTVAMQFVLLNSKQEIVNDIGEVALIPPALGLSQTLLNRDHYQVYFANMPYLNGKPLRRHGDQLQKINDFCYQGLGRVDDCMNLGGIKISAAEIERCINELPEVIESAAIALPPKQGGPSQLVLFIKPLSENSIETLLSICKTQIKTHLNPLFKIHALHIVSQLPRTASNKILRRVLRDQYYG